MKLSKLFSLCNQRSFSSYMTVELFEFFYTAYLASMRYALSVTKSINCNPVYAGRMDQSAMKKNLRNANDMQDSRRLWKADNRSCL